MSNIWAWFSGRYIDVVQLLAAMTGHTSAVWRRLLGRRRDDGQQNLDLRHGRIGIFLPVG
jgi:hypothetical protein